MVTRQDRFELPQVIDYGSIADHTFGHADPTCSPGQADPHKDTTECDLDCFGEYSCPSP